MGPSMHAGGGGEGFIMMDLTAPTVYRNAILRDRVAAAGSVICKLGVFGVCLSDNTAGADAVRGTATYVTFWPISSPLGVVRMHVSVWRAFSPEASEPLQTARSNADVAFLRLVSVFRLPARCSAPS